MSHLLHKSRIVLTFCVLSLVFSGCTKSNFRWLYYDETNCADKWEKNIINEKLKDNVVNYLDKQGIKVFEIEIFSDGTADACTDCACKTGRRIKCKVKKRDVSDIKRQGFY